MSGVQLFADAVENAFEESNYTRPILWICHSHGGILMKHALSRLSQRARDLLHVVTIDAAEFIQDKDCGSALNFVNSASLISAIQRLYNFEIGMGGFFLPPLNPNACIDRQGHLEQKGYVTEFLTPGDSSWPIHDFQSPVFKEPIQSGVEQFLQNEGV